MLSKEDQNEELTRRRSNLKLNLQILDLSHPGAKYFFELLGSDAPTVLFECVSTVWKLLYDRTNGCSDENADGTKERQGPTVYPKVRSITLILRPMQGIAHATSNVIDNEHKELHLSLDYIEQQFSKAKKAVVPPTGTSSAAQATPTAITASAATTLSGPSSSTSAAHAAKEEIKGVIVHELVHTLQSDGHGSCPPGLIEGIADWVRLKAGLAPPHWKSKPPSGSTMRWDAGYETTAYFLQWASEHLRSPHLVPDLNQHLFDHTWNGGEFFTSRYESQIEEMWDDYIGQCQ